MRTHLRNCVCALSLLLCAAACAGWAGWRRAGVEYFGWRFDTPPRLSVASLRCGPDSVAFVRRWLYWFDPVHPDYVDKMRDGLVPGGFVHEPKPDWATIAPPP